jgi:hypothetical protein
MARVLKQPCAGNCAGCGGAPPGDCAVGAITCASLEGDATLCGWSKFQNHNSGDWNLRKYQALVRVGSANTCFLEESYPDCPGASGGLHVVDYYPDISGSVSFSGCTAPSSGARQVVADHYGNPTQDSCAYDLGSNDPTVFDITTQGYVAAIALNASIESRTNTAIIWDGSETCADDGGTNTWDATVDQRIDISSPDSAYAALLRGSPASGSSCKTTAGTIGTTSAGSETAIAITDTRAVRATIPLTGLTIGIEYTVTIDLDRYTAGGGAYVDSITDSITFTAGATTESLEYDVPINTDYDYEITGASIPGCSGGGGGSLFSGLNFSTADNSGYVAII